MELETNALAYSCRSRSDEENEASWPRRKVGPGDNDGKCSDPEDVPECANYYGDLEFDKQDLVRAGVDPEAVGAEVAPSRDQFYKTFYVINLIIFLISYSVCP